MALNGVIAFVLRFDSFAGQLRHCGWR